MRILTLLILTACMTGGNSARAADARNASKRILVELFTSEGCSSCPPADAFLQRLDKSQPVPGAQVIVLSEHVDYWDHDGWKDAYSSPIFTNRQESYVRALGLDSPYTPQLIVNGTSELRLSDPQQVSQAMQKATQASQIAVNISAIRVEGGPPGVLRAHIDADGSTEKRNADVYVAVALDHAESQVLHGENGGRRLEHVAVVQELMRIGMLKRGMPFSIDLEAKLNPRMTPGNLRLIVFAQEEGSGRVLGAAIQEVITPEKETRNP